MKKIVLLFAVCALAMNMIGCNATATTEASVTTTETSENSVLSDNIYANLLELGFERGMIAVDYMEENTYQMCVTMISSEDRENVYRIYTTLTTEEQQEYEAIDFFDEAYEEKFSQFMEKFVGKMTAQDMKELIPSEEEMVKFVGKTLSEIEEMGYYQSSVADGDDGTITLVYADDTFEYAFYFEGEIKDFFSLAEEDLAKLVVARAEFFGFVQ